MTETRILMGMLGFLWITEIVLGGFMIKLMLDIKSDISKINEEIKDIHMRIDRLWSLIEKRLR
jgi:hypothetical protein